MNTKAACSTPSEQMDAVARYIRESSYYDTLVIAAGGAIPAETEFFARNRSAGAHLCNWRMTGEFGRDESFIVKAVLLEAVGTSVTDVSQLQKFCTITAEVAQQKFVNEQPICTFSQPGGAYGIEGANGATTLGVPTWTGVRLLQTPLLIVGGQAVRAYMRLGAGAAPAVIGASGLFLRLHLWGEDYTSA